MKKLNTNTIFLLFSLLYSIGFSQSHKYLWLGDNELQIASRVKDIPVLDGYERIKYRSNTYQDWLRNLPMKHGENKIRLYDGSFKINQNAHFKIIDIDVGQRNLQQCADAIIRLYSEYLYSQNKYHSITFNFTSGDRARYKSWADGYRPIIKGNNVKWVKNTGSDFSYQNFRKYLSTVFTYAGSYSLSKELMRVNDIDKIDVGDVFIKGGFPGHAVIVLDLAIHKTTNMKIFLLAQSFIPAQEIHILKNPRNEKLNPWYELKANEKLVTPEYIFDWSDLKRFKRKR